MAIGVLRRAGLGVGPDRGTGEYDPNLVSRVPVGKPVTVPTGKYETKVSGTVSAEGQIYVAGEAMGAPDQPGRPSVPYYRVFSDYRKLAESALITENIPASQRKRVKDYFEALAPE